MEQISVASFGMKKQQRLCKDEPVPYENMGKDRGTLVPT